MKATQSNIKKGRIAVALNGRSYLIVSSKGKEMRCLKVTDAGIAPNPVFRPSLAAIGEIREPNEQEKEFITILEASEAEKS